MSYTSRRKLGVNPSLSRYCALTMQRYTREFSYAAILIQKSEFTFFSLHEFQRRKWCSFCSLFIVQFAETQQLDEYLFNNIYFIFLIYIYK